MYGRLNDFYKRSFHDFFEGLVNIFFFLPYFFSIPTLSKTLFAPWKNLVGEKKTRGFSFGEFFNVLSFNLISRGMGFVMRSCLILFYVMLQVAFILLLLPTIAIYALLIPVLFIYRMGQKTTEQQKAELKATFLQTHVLDKANARAAEQWFEHRYIRLYKSRQWWKLSELFSIPPLARDWATGYTPTLDDYADDLCADEYQATLKHAVGREREIEQIERTLSKSEEANVLVVGDEGVGKHTIVDMLAKRIYEGKTNSILIYKRVLNLNMERILNQYLDIKQREEFLSQLFTEAAKAHNVIILIENFDRYVGDGNGRIDLTSVIERYAKTPYIQFIGITSPHAYQKYVAANDKINRLFTKIDVFEVSKQEAFSILLDSSDIFEARYQINIPYETLVACVEKSDFFITDIPFPEKAFKLLDDTCVYTVQHLKQDTITPQTIDTVLTEKTHIPTSLNTEFKQKLLNLETLLNIQIVDQQEAISEVASALRRSFLLLGKRKKPLASFLFLGPTGVGKTETAKAITKSFFGSDQYMIRFDMSLYQTTDDIAHLIGTADDSNPGLLTQAIRQTPYGLLLLDEIEKANKDLLNIFLSVIDEAYFTDGGGKRVDCKNLVIIATSNAGADLLKQNSGQIAQKDVLNYLIEKGIFSPEFLNRFDGVVVYKYLQGESIYKVAKKMITSIQEKVSSLYNVSVVISDNTLQAIASQSYDANFGARDMERLIRKNIEDIVAKQILENKVQPGQQITI